MYVRVDFSIKTIIMAGLWSSTLSSLEKSWLLLPVTRRKGKSHWSQTKQNTTISRTFSSASVNNSKEEMGEVSYYFYISRLTTWSLFFLLLYMHTDNVSVVD